MSHYEKAEEQQKRQKEEEAVFYANVKNAMKSKSTRDLVWNILSLCGIYDIPFDRLEYYNGRRSVGCDILKMLALADENLYIELLNQHKEE